MSRLAREVLSLSGRNVQAIHIFEKEKTKNRENLKKMNKIKKKKKRKIMMEPLKHVLHTVSCSSTVPPTLMMESRLLSLAYTLGGTINFLRMSRFPFTCCEYDLAILLPNSRVGGPDTGLSRAGGVLIIELIAAVMWRPPSSAVTGDTSALSLSDAAVLLLLFGDDVYGVLIKR